MAEEIQVPREALETLLKIKSTLEVLLNQLQGVQMGVDGSVTVRPPTVQATAHIPAASSSATARPDTVQATAHIPTPVVGALAASLPSLAATAAGRISEGAMQELPSEEAAQGVLIALTAALGSARETMAFFADLEGLLQVIERLRDLLL